MNFVEVMQTYFRSEKLETLYFVLTIGIALVVFGVVAIRTENSGFAWGVAIASIMFGLALMGTGIGVAARTNGQIAGIKAGYESDPAPWRKKSSPAWRKSIRISGPHSMRLGFWQYSDRYSTIWRAQHEDGDRGRCSSWLEHWGC